MSLEKGPRPKALLVTTVHWASTTRLCLALIGSGFEVAAVAPVDHGVRKLKAVSAHYVCGSYLGATASLAEAIDGWSPDIVIPCDDPAVNCLHALYAQAARGGGLDPRRIMALIERSLGDPSSHSIAVKKSAFIAFARTSGLSVPHTAVIRNREDLRARLSAKAFPQVLKADGSWSGLGVRIVGSLEEAERALSELASPPSWPCIAKRAVEAWSLAPLRHLLSGRKPTITLQEYVEGRPANRAVLCWEGKVVAGLSVEALETTGETGPATVVRIIDHSEMENAAAHIVRRLHLSGFVGFDFMLEAATGRSLLIEMNPRPTQICHLSFSYEMDMTGALFAKLSGTARRSVEKTAIPEIVALFPQELWRNPHSDYLRSSYHDVPWEEPQFVGAYALPVSPDVSGWLGSLQRYVRAPKGERRLPKPQASMSRAAPRHLQVPSKIGQGSR